MARRYASRGRSRSTGRGRSYGRAAAPRSYGRRRTSSRGASTRRASSGARTVRLVIEQAPASAGRPMMGLDGTVQAQNMQPFRRAQF